MSQKKYFRISKERLPLLRFLGVFFVLSFLIFYNASKVSAENFNSISLAKAYRNYTIPPLIIKTSATAPIYILSSSLLNAFKNYISRPAITVIPPPMVIVESQNPPISSSSGPRGVAGPRGTVGLTGPQGPRGEAGNNIDTSSFIPRTLFDSQVDRIFDSIGDSAQSLSGSLGEEVTTDLLTVSGNATVGGDFTVTGNLIGNVVGAITNATLTTALTVNGGTLTLTGDGANTSVLTVGAGAVSISGTNTGDDAANSSTMFIGTTSQALNRASAAEVLTGITGLTPGANFVLTQNSVAAFTSEETGAIVNTLYLKEGNVGIGTTTPGSALTVNGMLGVTGVNGFVQSPYSIVAPTKIIGKGTGALTSITTAVAAGANPYGIATDPTGRFVYVVNYSASTVSMYSINQTTGALTSITSAIASGVSPYVVSTDPTGRFVYVGNYSAATISMYSINQTTGALTSITSDIASGVSPSSIATDPTGRFFYVTNYTPSTVSMYSINQTTGALTSITSAIATGVSPEGIAIDPTGRFVYVTNTSAATVSMYSINQTTGALTSITSAIATGSGPRGVATDPTGRFVYVVNNPAATVSMYSINQTTGALTSITSDIASGSAPSGIATDPTGQFVYVVNNTASTVSMYSINQITGALTSITSAIAAGTNPYAIATDPTGRFVYVGNNTAGTVSMYSINNFSAGSGTFAGALSGVTTLSMAGALSGVTTLTMNGALSGVTTLAHSGIITGTVPTLYVSTDAHILTAAASTGVTGTLVPLDLSPRIRQVGQAWDIDGATNVLNNYWLEVIPYPGNTVNSKLSWYYAQGTMATAAEYQAPEIMNYYNNGLNILGSTYGTESLTNGTLTSGTSWSVANGFSLTADTAVYVHNASGGSLTQTSANFAVPVKANRWYRFTYTSSALNTTARAYIDPAGISLERVYLKGTVVTAGTYTTTFKTNSAPGDFIITADSAAASDGFTLDTLSLVEVTSGDIIANGLFTGGGTTGIKIDNAGSVGIGTTAPAKRLDVLDASAAQLRLTQTNASVYSELYADASGDLQISTTGTAGIKSARMNDGNLWVCNSGACSTLVTTTSPPTTNGNIVVENAVILDNNFKLKQTGSTTVDMLDSGDNTIVEFDEGT